MATFLRNLPSFNKDNFSNFQPDINKSIPLKQSIFFCNREYPDEQIIINQRCNLVIQYLEKQNKEQQLMFINSIEKGKKREISDVMKSTTQKNSSQIQTYSNNLNINNDDSNDSTSSSSSSSNTSKYLKKRRIIQEDTELNNNSNNNNIHNHGSNHYNIDLQASNLNNYTNQATNGLNATLNANAIDEFIEIDDNPTNNNNNINNSINTDNSVSLMNNVNNSNNNDNSNTNNNNENDDELIDL